MILLIFQLINDKFHVPIFLYFRLKCSSITMMACSLKEDPCLFRLNIIPDVRQNWIHRKRYCENGQFQDRFSTYQNLLYSKIIRFKPDQKWNNVAVSGLGLPTPHFPFSIKFKIFYSALWVMNFHFTTTLRRKVPATLSLLSSKCSGELHSFVTPILTFTTKATTLVYFVFHY